MKKIFGNIALLAGLLLIAQATVHAQQLQLSLMLQPPYSPYLSDYMVYQNKTLLTVIKPANSTVSQIYLKGSIVGDNGVSAATKPGYKPSAPILLTGPTTVLRGNDFENTFGQGSIDIKGIDVKSMTIGDGLPEGNYTVCVIAYDYITDVPVSAQTCAVLPVQHVEPPILTSPMCEGKVFVNPSQFISFSWSQQPGAPANTHYVLKMVELLPGQNPNNALSTITTPPFFEKEIATITSYQYKLSDPALKPGKTYAWQVTAFDPSNKVLFRNNGSSVVCTFAYEDLPGPPDNLVLSSPLCRDTISHDSLIVGGMQNLAINWIWASQLAQLKTNDSFDVLQKANGQTIATYKVEIVPLQKEGKPRMPVKETEKRVTRMYPATRQFAIMTPDEVTAAGLKNLHWYYVTVTALNSDKKEIATVKSCEMMLVPPRQAGLSITVKGKVVYKLEDNGQAYGANKTSIQLGLSKDSLRSKSSKMSQANSVTVTTDDDGDFSALVPVTAADTNLKYIEINVNSSYYKQLAKNIPIAIFNKPVTAKETTSGIDGSSPDLKDKSDVKYTLLKEEVALGNVTVDAFTYTLKLHIGKGFPEFYYDTIKKKTAIKYQIDTFSVNKNVKVKAGIPVVIYRKSKLDNIPYQEGDNYVKGGKGEKLIVAKSVTTIEKDKYGKESTVVVFKRLLCNRKNDEYYIQADIPKPTNGAYINGQWVPTFLVSDNPEDDEKQLVAPEQRLVFRKRLEALKTRYEMDTTYNLISTIPPMSLVKGKIMYQWPSKPGVLLPLANTDFSINVSYLVDGHHFKFIKEGKCGPVLPGKISLPKEEGGDIPDAMGNVVVGMGKTDAQGNFSVKIVNYDYKGVISKNANVTDPLEPGCNTKVKEKNAEVADPVIKVLSKIKDWNVKDLSDIDVTSGIKIIDDAGNSFDVNGNASTKGGYNAGAIGAKGLSMLGFIPATYMASLDKQPVEPFSAGHGPSMPIENESAGDDDNPNGGHIVERVLTIRITSPNSQYYQQIVDPNDNTDTSDIFTVQAFETKDLGTLLTNVGELSKTITVKIKDAKGPDPISQAKLVVFRWDVPGNKPKNAPIGEGSVNHPYKELIQSSMVGDKQGEKAEWIIDTGFSIQPGNVFKLSKNKLLARGGHYMIQIAPNLNNSGAIFEQRTMELGSADTVVLTLSDAKIIGRVLEEGTGKSLGNAEIVINSMGKQVSATQNADDEGYFEYQNQHGGPIDWDYGAKKKDSVRIVVSKEGYKTYTSSWFMVPSQGKQEYHNVTLKPSDVITGIVVNEDNNPIEAYIMRSDSSVFETMGKVLPLPGKPSNTGRFSVPVANIPGQKIRIIPKDPAYFDSSLALSVLLGPNPPKTIVMPGRKHRMVFHITAVNADGSKISMSTLAAKPFRVTINNDNSQLAGKGLLNDIAVAYFKFENVSVNNYSVQIADAADAGFIPQTINIADSESRENRVYEIIMKKGGVITGNVTLGGKPLANAHVYVEHENSGSVTGVQFNTYEAMEAKTDAGGNYKIAGIPILEGSVIVHATKDTNTMLIAGGHKSVNMTGGKKEVNFDLKKMADAGLSNLHGFPITAEYVGVSLTDPNLFLITGLVDLSKSKNDIDWLDNNKKVRVKNVPYRLDKLGNFALLKPDLGTNEVPTTQVALKMKYNNKYNVELASGKAEATPLSIKKKSWGGVIEAQARIVDNSYNYPSTYLNFENSGEFYLCNVVNKKTNTTIDAITSFKQENNQYKLCNKDGAPLSFSFIGFPATASPDSSYVDKNGFIHLNVSINGKIPNAQPGDIKINIPDVVLDDKSIKPAVGSYPLKANLGSWTLLVNDWTIDPKQGGIVSKKAVIETGVVDITAANFNLRHDLFVLNKFDFSNLTLGNGLIKLEDVNKDDASLVYDLKTGSDGKPHWRFNIASHDNKPAAVFYLDDDKKERLELEYIQMISYGKENIITLRDCKNPINVGGNDKIEFRPQTISSDNGMLVLGGEASYKVPRMSANKLYVNYKLVNGKKEMGLQAFDFELDGKGYVKFKNDKKVLPVFSNGILTFKGTIAEPGKFEPMPCTFSFGKGNPGRIDIPEGYRVNLTKNAKDEPNILKLRQRTADGKLVNGMEVQGLDWSTFRFSGNIVGNSTLDSNKSVLDFEVLGDITANSSGVQATQIATPFGAMDLIYDFEKNTMHGAMTMDKTQFGSWLFSGDVEVNFGADGWNVLGAGQLNTGILLVKGFGTFSAGMALGNYKLSPDAINKVVQFSKDPKSTCWLTGHNDPKFSGFYFTGGYDILNESEGFDLEVVAVYLNAVLGIEASIGASLSDNKYVIGLGAHGSVTAGVNAITGTSVQGKVDAHVTAQTEMTGALTDFTVSGSANLNVAVEICQSYIVDKACWSESVGAGADFIYEKGQKPTFDFYIHSGVNNFQCPDPNK